MLYPLKDIIIIPQTKLTLLVIQWAACNFGLGKKVYSEEDVDPCAFWNADPMLIQDLFALPDYGDQLDSESSSNLIPPPELENHRPDAIYVFPEFNVDTCTCRGCASFQSAYLRNNPRSFLKLFDNYCHTFTSHRDPQPSPGGPGPMQLQLCDALERAWEPELQAAEDWLDNLIGRVNCSDSTLPWPEERRTSAAVLQVANMMGVRIESQLSDEQLLHFIVMLAIVVADKTLPEPLGDSGIGYIVSLPWAADREEFRAVHDGDGVPDRTLFVTGGWLYDLAYMEGVTVLHEREDVRIIYNTTMPATVFPICMRDIPPTFIWERPHRHIDMLEPASSTPSTSRPSDMGAESLKTTIILSDIQSDPFLLHSRSPPEYAALAALIRVEVYGRSVESIWRPDVTMGSPCEHEHLWNHMTYCSPTAFDLIRQDPPGRSILGRYQSCIVRCGANDGQVHAMVILAASLKKKVYILHRQ